VDAMSETDPAILGVQSCGCITFAHSRPDVLDREDQKAIGEIVASGGQIIRTTVGEARKMPHFLVGECPHDPKGWEPYRPVDSYEPKASYRRTTRGGRPVRRRRQQPAHRERRPRPSRPRARRRAVPLAAEGDRLADPDRSPQVPCPQ
jgi:hypothetical protein